MLEIIEHIAHLHQSRKIVADCGILPVRLSVTIKKKETLKRQNVLISSIVKESTKTDVDASLFLRFTAAESSLSLSLNKS